MSANAFDAMRSYQRRPTGNVMKPGMNYLSELIVRPGIQKKFWPMLLYRGGMGPGHAHRLWNMALLMMAAEAETLADGIKIVNNPAFNQLCGPVRTPAKLTMWMFFTRLYSSPDVTDNIPGFTEYVKSMKLGPCNLTPVELESARANCASWRISTHKEPGKEPGERGTPQLFYPYAVHESEKPDDGKELVLLVNKAVPQGLPEHIRADVCQDIIVSILAGELKRENVKDHVQKRIGKIFNAAPWKWEGGMTKLSMDAPLNGFEDDFSLSDVISDGTYIHWSDEMENENEEA